jgi:predicted transcriptional regulator
MKAHDFRFIRDTLGLSNSKLATLLGVEPRTVRRYSDGSRPVPGPVARLMWLLNDDVIKPVDLR